MLIRIFRSIINLVVTGIAMMVAYFLMAIGMFAGLISVLLIDASEKVMRRMWIPRPKLVRRILNKQAEEQGRCFKTAGV